MRNSIHWGLGSNIVFLCIFLVARVHICIGVGNLTTRACLEHERLALIEFKHSVNDDHGWLSSWGVGNDCCSWERVDCNEAGRVVGLHLNNIYQAFGSEEYEVSDASVSDQLVGDEVNSCLTELVNLEFLDMSGVDFKQSRIPKFIGSFKQLRYLNLSGAGFSGNIPQQIGNLTNLKVLDLNSLPFHPQELVTYDMTWISGLSKLEHLDLSGVDLTRTRNLDILLYTIPSLSKLSLSECRFSMAHLGSRNLNSSRKLANIKHLDLSGNELKGKLPDLFFNMTSLTFLDLSRNDLGTTWSFENFLNSIPFVSELHLSQCGIQNINLSPTNVNFSTHFNIRRLDLSQNEIEGTFPSLLTNMSSLLSLDLSQNGLNSSIPVMPNLLKLDISENSLGRIENIGLWRQCHLRELIATASMIEGEMVSPSTNVSECSQNALEVLYLNNNAFNSPIHESLGRLTNLRHLDISFSQLKGPIPESLAKLRSLQGLDLSENELSGPIPKFQYRELTTLHLASNKLNGFIPESLGRSPALREIYLQSNQLSGPIPVSLGGLTSLRLLSVSSNLLNGTIPNSIGKLTKLNVLDVSNNFLQGTISEDHFANLTMLKYLDANSNSNLFFNISPEWIPPFQLKIARLGSCKIDDGFPQWVRTQRKLEELVLSNASISGPLPTWLHLVPIMYVLDLSQNKLTGTLTNVPILGVNGTILLLQNNFFEGSIPRWLCTMTHLDILDLSSNRLIGKPPNCLWNMSSSVIQLGSNKLSGVTPSPFGFNSFLTALQLSDNNFNGELPRDLAYFTNLNYLDLGGNKISGNIPEWIGENLTYLRVLRLHKNNFTGRIPHSLCKCEELQILDLAHNNITGSIPRCFGGFGGMITDAYGKSKTVYPSYGNMMQVLKGAELDYTKTLKFVVNMDLSSNKLVGEIPEALTKLVALIGLNLSYNHLRGGIPKNIGNMKSLISLDLSGNKLTGMIPQSVSALNFLSYLNLSHNNLSGQIPTGNQLQTLRDPSIYDNNTYLCGAPLPKECFTHGNSPTATRNKNANEPDNVWFYLGITCGFITGFWGIIGVLLIKRQWRHKLFMFSEVTIRKIYDVGVAIVVRVLKKRRAAS